MNVYQQHYYYSYHHLRSRCFGQKNSVDYDDDEVDSHSVMRRIAVKMWERASPREGGPPASLLLLHSRRPYPYSLHHSYHYYQYDGADGAADAVGTPV